MFSDTFGTTYNKICRICLKGCDSSVHIFSNIHINSDKILKECIEDISDIVITPEDNLPDSICPKCLKELDQCYNFRILTRKTDDFLHKILEGDFIEETKEDADTELGGEGDVDKVHEASVGKSDCDSKIASDEPETLVVEPVSPSCAELEEELSRDIEIVETSHENQIINEQEEESETTEAAVEGELYIESAVEKEKKFKCEYCLVRFVYLKNKRQHEKRHVREGSKECSICQKKLYTNYDLKRHLFTHKNEKKYKCDKCSKVYLTQSELNRHFKTHDSVKRYKCGHCGRDFFELGVLNFHVKTVHLSERRHQCNTCGKCFTTGSKVRRHQKSKTCGQRKTVTTVHCEDQFMILEESDIVYNSEDVDW